MNQNDKVQEMTKSLKVFAAYGVDKVNIRTFGSGAKANRNLVINVDDQAAVTIASLLQGEPNQSLFTTFNKIKGGIFPSKNKAISDLDIEDVRFFFIDIDPVKADKSASATSKEKHEAEQVAESVLMELKKYSIEDVIRADSGNGVHILLPIVPMAVEEGRKLCKSFLNFLSDNFSNEHAKIDCAVHNPSRLTKLYGCRATKGSDTPERPHRQSKLTSIPAEPKLIDISLIKKMIESGSADTKHLEQPEDFVKRSDKYIEVDARTWLDYHKLSYQCKKGKVPGFEILALNQCPLKHHSTNKNGASVITNRAGKTSFKCLHDSHQSKTILDLIEAFPIPDSARYPNRVTCEKLEAFGQVLVGRSEVRKDGVFLKKDDGSSKIASCFFVSKQYYNVDTKVNMYQLTYLIGRQWERRLVQAGYLTKRNIVDLANSGIDIYPNADAATCEYIIEQKNSVPMELVHSFVGWRRDEENRELVFNGECTIPFSKGNNKKTMLDPTAKFQMKTAGTIENWRAAIDQHVIGSDMELALVLAPVSILLSYLFIQNIVELRAFLIVLLGKSSTGKTTAQKVIANFYGNPKSLMLSLNATANALMNSMNRNFGVPMISDELGAADFPNMSGLIYSIASGKDKARLNSSGEPQEIAEFSTVSIWSSEQSLLGFLDNREGLSARFCQFENVQWTKSAEHASKLAEFCNTNYGHGVLMFINAMKQQGEEKIADRYRQAKVEAEAFLEDSHLKKRVVDIYALYILSARILKDDLQFNLDIENLKKILTETGLELSERLNDKGEDLTQRVKEILVINSGHFFAEQSSPQFGNPSQWGSYKLVSSALVVRVLKNRFEMLIKSEFNVLDPLPIIRELVAQKMISTEKGRNTKRKKYTVNGGKESIAVYEVHLPKNLGSRFPGQISEVDTDPSKSIFENQPALTLEEQLKSFQ